ncbi:MAG: hypothetical protein U9Q33_00685 [Campylobacterota bacterium]|nr:hypothetical protein [Campylobacterota bacterium]
MSKTFDDCIEKITKEKFFIKDDIPNHPAYIVNEKGQFEVINNTQKEIGFLVIDDCVYDSSDESRCDCAIFDESKFCFIELKVCKIKKQKFNRKKADEQLKETIINFKEMDITKGKTLEAYSCLNCEHEEGFVRITNASSQDTILEFEEEYNTNLHYTCTKEFS